jgi:hypothetical protein
MWVSSVLPLVADVPNMFEANDFEPAPTVGDNAITVTGMCDGRIE